MEGGRTQMGCSGGRGTEVGEQKWDIVERGEAKWDVIEGEGAQKSGTMEGGGAQMKHNGGWRDREKGHDGGAEGVQK